MNSRKLKSGTVFLSFFLLLFIQFSNAQTQDQLKVIAEAENTKTVFIKHHPQLSEFFLSAYSYIIFSDLKEGTYAQDGVAGNGVVYKGDKVLGTAQLTQEDVGMELDGRSFRQVILFENETQFDRYASNELHIPTNGRNIVLNQDEVQDMAFFEGLLIVTMPKEGAQIDISVEGQQFTFHEF